ncbi:MAG: hypothetical protein MJ109_02205 [Kiritimatiellae bacterium]|nr:hypothetical protein [Kiritimatiellia bacterium]
MEAQKQEEIKAYLARIKKTVEASKALMESVDLRLKETDRLLEAQGLTRDDVRKMRFTPEQRARANEELERMGLDPIEEVKSEADFEFNRDDYRERFADSADVEDESVIESRQRKFGTFMQQYRL